MPASLIYLGATITRKQKTEMSTVFRTPFNSPIFFQARHFGLGLQPRTVAAPPRLCSPSRPVFPAVGFGIA